MKIIFSYFYDKGSTFFANFLKPVFYVGCRNSRVVMLASLRLFQKLSIQYLIANLMNNTYILWGRQEYHLHFGLCNFEKATNNGQLWT